MELTASADVIVQRVEERLQKGERHAAHHDLNILAELKKPVPSFGYLVTADQYRCIATDDFTSVKDIAELTSWVVQK